MKKKIAILLSAMMVASAMPFSATAAELKGDSVLNAAFPKTDKTIDPNASSYITTDGQELNKEDIKDRQSALSLNFDNNSKSGGLEKDTTFKIKLEGGTFDTDILNKYQYVNTANGKSVSYNTAMGYDSNSGTYSANTLTDVFKNIVKANKDTSYNWSLNTSSSAKLDDVMLSDVSPTGNSIQNQVKKVVDVVSAANSAQTTTTVNGETLYVDGTGTGIKISTDQQGQNTLTVGGFSFDGNTDTTTEAHFLALVDALNGTNYSARTTKTVSDIMKDEVAKQFNENLDILPHIPYILEIDNDTTATVTIPVSISDDEAKKVLFDAADAKEVTGLTGSTGVSNSSGVLSSWGKTGIADITKIVNGGVTFGNINSNGAEFADPYMVLPLGAVVADGEAPVKVTVDGGYTDKVKTSTHTITKGDVSGSTSIVYPESSIKRFDEDIMLSPIVLKENASRTIGKHVSNDTSTPDTDIFLRLSGGFRYKLDPNKYVVNSSTGEITAQGTGSIKYNPATGEGLISDDSGNIQNWDNLTVKAYLINESTIKFTVQGLQNKNTREKAIGFRFSNLAVEPTNNKNFGDVTLSVSGDGINSASTVVARREQLGFKLETLQDPKNIVVGRYYVADNNEVNSSNAGLTTGGTKNGTMLEEKNTTVEIKFSEAIPNTLVESRALNFNVPEGVKIVDAEIYDSKNLNNFDDTDFEITNNGTTLKLNRNNVSSSYQVANKDKIAEFKMKLSLSVDPAYSEENITLGVTGGGQSETVETVIAKAKKPFEVTTTTTKANMGYQTYNTANITITETEPGMFLENREVVLNLVAPYGTAELGFSEATYKVDGEELKVDDRSFKVGDYKNGGNTNYGIIRFEIDKASHKTANSITIENVKVGTTRSVPYGSYALGISGDAVINNYNEDVKDNKDFAIASKLPSDNGSDLANLYMQNNTSRFEVKEYVNIITETGTFDDVVRVTIGEKTVLIGDKAVDMDVAPYIQASSNSTMVPLRFVSVALGVDSASIDNPDASNKIAWDANTKTTTIYYGEGTGQKIIQFQAGSNIMTVDGTRIPMEYGVKAEIKDGRMFVPFRALGQALGINVHWDPNTRTAIYNADKVPNLTEAPTTVTESTTESTTASDSTTTESTTAKQ